MYYGGKWYHDQEERRKVEQCSEVRRHQENPRITLTRPVTGRSLRIYPIVVGEVEEGDDVPFEEISGDCSYVEELDEALG